MVSTSSSRLKAAESCTASLQISARLTGEMINKSRSLQYAPHLFTELEINEKKKSQEADKCRNMHKKPIAG